MQVIELTTGLACLLENGDLRDAFATDPNAVASQLNIREADRAAFVNLRPADLEYQSDILLRKRLGKVKPLLPPLRSLGDDLWPAFRSFARTNPPQCPIHEAHAFCNYLRTQTPGVTKSPEWNRLEFAIHKRTISLHLVRHSSTHRRILQLLIITRHNHCHEFRFSFEHL